MASSDTEATPKEALPAPSGLNFPVVGVGASAGGLGALIKLFEGLPAAPDMAFVIILHLSPKHDSNAAAILQRATRMPVSQVQADVPIERNHVYVIPPTHSLRMYDGHVALSESPKERGAPVAIDLFFRTLAEAHGERAVGIVLSGTGADGSVGIARLKEKGGVVITQSPADAEYSGMPDSAIATGKVDIVLPVADIPQRLVDLWENARGIVLPTPDLAGLRSLPPPTPDAAQLAEEALRGVMGLLLKRTGNDFKHYKRATVLRRMERRLQVVGVPDLPAYLGFMNENPSEAGALLDDMLLNVTNFFRDREAFEALEREVIPALFDASFKDEQLRAWVSGCSSGEEAYSIAILLLDAASRAKEVREIQLFASDIDEDALASARQGKYPEAIVTDVPPAFLRGFFTREGATYRVQEPVRKKVLFAAHNLLRDPPFSRLDLVSCRNLLIYLDRSAQKDILETFHFALRPGGYLFLGTSETPDAAAKLFSLVDKKNHIYRANPSARTVRSIPSLGGGFHRPVQRPTLKLPKPELSPSRPNRIGSLHEKLLLDDYTPASVVIDADGQIVHVSSGADRFLRFGKGDPSHQLLSVVPQELQAELRTAIFQANQAQLLTEAQPVRLDMGGKAIDIRMLVRPINRNNWPPDLSLVVFRESDAEASDPDAAAMAAGGRDPVVAHLEQALHHKEEQLQATIEQHDTSVEDLKSANEELQAINEELRSAGEELETGKEELQSTNEELETVNVELKIKVDETTQVTDDLQNLVRSSEIATVFVDPEMRIKRYTPAAARIFNIIESDVGRSLLDITHKLDYEDLAADAKASFASLRTVEREVRSSDGHWYLARLLPYRTADDRIDGAVLNFVDISSRLLTETRMHMGEERLKLLADSVPDFAIFTLDSQGNFSSWSGGAERLFGYAEREILGRSFADLFSLNDREQGAPQAELQSSHASGAAFADRWLIRKDGTKFFASGTLTLMSAGVLSGYGMIVRDVTDRQNEARGGAVVRQEAETAARLKDEFLAVLSHELKHPLNLIHVNAQLLLSLPQAKAIPAVSKAGATIERSVAAQARIIDDLLDLSRTQAGKLTIDRTAVDLAQAITPSLQWAKTQSAAKGVVLEDEGFDQPLVVLADVVRVEQVVWNLLSNAIKFTSSGGKIHVRLLTEGENAVFEVADNGRGIAPAFLPHVFDMFRQEEGHMSRKEGGLGIGLGLVKALVALHGGDVRASSPGPGRGSTFRVTLPLHQRSEFADLAPSESEANPLRGVRILLVDDAVDALDTLAMLLELEGALVTVAGSGQQALVQSRTNGFDLIVSDLGMPEMDGNELVEQFRRQPETELTPAIALTGYGRPQDVHAAMRAGFNAHLTKPVDIGKLRRLAAELVANRRG